MDGGSGWDTLLVNEWNGTYKLDMETGVTNFSGETAINFEAVITGNGDDTIQGGAGGDTLYGANTDGEILINGSFEDGTHAANGVNGLTGWSNYTGSPDSARWSDSEKRDPSMVGTEKSGARSDSPRSPDARSWSDTGWGRSS